MKLRRTKGDRAIPDRRARVAAFVNRHRLAWDASMGMLGLGFFIFGLISGEEVEVYSTLCVLVVLIFVTEFALRLWASHDRRLHLKSNWLHAILLLPLVSSLRIFAGLRAIRLINLAKVIGHIGHVVFHNVHVFFSRKQAVALDAVAERSTVGEVST